MKKLLLFTLLSLIITVGCHHRTIYVKDTTRYQEHDYNEHDQYNDQYDDQYDDHRYNNQQNCPDDNYYSSNNYEEVCVQTAPPRMKRERYRPRRPSRKYIWIQGNWKWNGHRYHWKKGRWRKIQRGYRRWNAGRWTHKRRGWIWIRGSWG